VAAAEVRLWRGARGVVVSEQPPRATIAAGRPDSSDLRSRPTATLIE
jgi:hypothetical protein